MTTEEHDLLGPWVPEPQGGDTVQWMHPQRATWTHPHIYAITPGGTARRLCKGDEANAENVHHLTAMDPDGADPCKACMNLNLTARVHQLEGDYDNLARHCVRLHEMFREVRQELGDKARAWDTHVRVWTERIRGREAA